MTQAKAGDKVRVHFTGSLKDGSIFGSTQNEGPFEFTIGEKSVLPGFEDAVIGMMEGDKKTVSLSPEDAYGHYREDLVFVFERSEFPPETKLEVGKRLQVRLKDGSTALVIIKDMTEDSVILDANDPLAGEAITFNIKLVKIS